MVPRVGCSKPAIIRSTVVLPDPDGPSIEKNSPDSMLRSASSTATTGGRPVNSLRRPRSLMAGELPPDVVPVAAEVMSLLRRRSSGIKTYGPICFDGKTLVQIVACVLRARNIAASPGPAEGRWGVGGPLAGHRHLRRRLR